MVKKNVQVSVPEDADVTVVFDDAKPSSSAQSAQVDSSSSSDTSSKNDSSPDTSTSSVSKKKVKKEVKKLASKDTMKSMGKEIAQTLSSSSDAKQSQSSNSDQSSKKRPPWHILAFIVAGIILVVVVLWLAIRVIQSTLSQTSDPKPESPLEEAFQEEKMVTFTSSGFDPSDITVPPGTEVIWRNETDTEMILEPIEKNGVAAWPPLSQGAVASNDTASLLFQVEGTFYYKDAVSGSEGVVNVQ